MNSLKTLLLIFFVTYFTHPLLAKEKKIISLSPATTEIIFALNAGALIIGDTTFCNYPEEAKSIDKVGTFSEPNIEKIISLKPDIVFAAGLEQAPTVERLEKIGLRVVTSDPKNIAELFESIMQIGKEIGREKEAKILIEEMKKRIEIIKAKVKLVPEQKRLKVFLEIWYEPVMTVGPGSIVDELLNLAGAKNIAYDVPRSYSRFSQETIIQRNPDIIILGYMTKENTKDLVSKRLGWKNINAVKNKRIIYDINPDLMLRPSPRIVKGLEEIYRHIYEE